MSKSAYAKNELVEQMIADKAARVETVKASHFLFFHVYFPHYVKYQTAPFHKEIFVMTENDNTLDIIVAFRDSGKSSIVTTSYPLWAILGEQNKKFILLVSQTKPKAQDHLKNIKRELENNNLLKSDLGPFQEESDEWGVHALTIPKFNAKIMIGSVEQSIRGARHNQHRPDCVILDDVEDTQSVKTQESRDKTWNWFTSEIIPAATKSSHIIAVGNLLHRDSLLKRVEKKIASEEVDGTYKEFPVIDNSGNPLWPGKYPDKEAIEAERNRVMDKHSWHREYLLEIIPDHDQIISEDWIHYYDTLPDKKREITYIGIDPAISKEDTADYTAMVPIRIFGRGSSKKIYILPNIVNEKLTHMETIERATNLSNTITDNNRRRAKLYVEDVAYQKALVEQLDNRSYNRVEGIKVGGQDKWARLNSVSHLFQGGDVYFPETDRADRVVNQILGFGTEKHDDLVDALTLVLLQVTKKKRKKGGVGGKVDKL